jgi:hypothetical protein
MSPTLTRRRPLTSLTRRQIAILESLASRPREQGVDIGITFDVNGTLFDLYVKARTFESFIGHAGEMTTEELGEVVDRLVMLAQAEPELSSPPAFRLVASVN